MSHGAPLPDSFIACCTVHYTDNNNLIFSSKSGLAVEPTRWVSAFYMGGDSSVGIANSYGLDGSGIESRWWARFSASVQTGPGAHPASYTMGTGPFPGVKRPGRGVDHPPPSTVAVKERVQLYLYFKSEPFLACCRVNLPFYYRRSIVREIRPVCEGNHSFHLVLRLRLSGAISRLPLCALITY
jgi:hypothetical protein